MPAQLPPHVDAEDLADNALLAGLGDEDRAVLAGYLEVVHYESGEAMIEQGAADRDLYLLLDGVARIRRNGLDLGLVRRGDHFGELALLDPHPRAATVRTEEPVVAARLTPEGLADLAAAHPGLAFRLTRAFVTGVGDKLRAMTDEVGHLLRERSLPRRTHVTIDLDGEGKRTVPTGTPIYALFPERVKGRLVVAGLLDRRAVSLGTPLSTDGTLQPVTTSHWEGRGTLRQSAALLLLEALHLEGAEARMGQMAGVAQRVALRTGRAPDLAERVQARYDALVAEDLPLREEWWTVDEALEWFSQRGRHEVADLLVTRREAMVLMVGYGQVYAIGLVPLVHRTGLLGGARVLPNTHGLLFVHALDARPKEAPTENGQVVDHAREQARTQRAVAQLAGALMSQPKRWQTALGIRTVGQFNRACIDGRVTEVIRVVEGAQEKRIGAIADAIATGSGKVRLVCVAGPSSSGKTTFLKRLRVQLQVEGVQPLGIELDNYFRDREDTPKDAKGEYDFESFEAVRHELLATHLAQLLAGQTITTPRYDFPSGKGLDGEGPTLHLQQHQVLLIEGIHGLNPRLLGNLGRDQAFRIFIGPVSQLPFDDLTRVHGTDVRLLRRIVRDRHHRGHSAADTIQRWPSVRRGERLHIFPFMGQADAVFDTSLVYELAVLKVFAERYLLEVPRHQTAYATAYRLLRLLDQFVTIYPDQVPQTSLLREFIGGSGFDE